MDRGVSFAAAKQLLAAARRLCPRDLREVHHGFFCKRFLDGGVRAMQLMLTLQGGDCLRFRPTTGLSSRCSLPPTDILAPSRVAPPAIEVITREEQWQAMSVEDAEKEWTRLYDDDVCACRLAKQACKHTGRGPCTTGKRTYEMHLLTGNVLSVWPALADREAPIKRVRVINDDGTLNGTPRTTLVGLDVEPACCRSAWQALMDLGQELAEEREMSVELEKYKHQIK